MKYSLHQITSELREIDTLIEDNCGELSDKHEMILSKLTHELTLKTDGVADFNRKQSNHIQQIKDRIKELQCLLKVEENKLDSFKSYVKMCMDARGLEQIKGDFNKISLQRCPESLEIVDENKVPAAYKVVSQSININKNEIKAHLKAGIEVDGVKLKRNPKKVVFK